MGGKVKTDKKESASLCLKLSISICYMVASSSLTFINKFIYEKYDFKHPKILFLIQCAWNIFICMSLMCYKQFVNKKAFESAKNYGIEIPSLFEALQPVKLKLGMKIAAMTLTGVLFGLYSVKLVSIPLFLTFRRCAIIATIVV